ncbi:MAG TPA: methionyl-tRNA formyltransferase [Candidatus Peribacteraceae bacterium]|nr:methionyl-tRNA formyltransferase [Candidatus Peribacteraceae bacterium]
MPSSVVFCGTPAFAVPTLHALIADPEFTVKLVITQPDKPMGRKQQVVTPPVKADALQHGLPVAQPEKIGTFTVPPCDWLVVVAYGQIIPQKILAIPTKAPVNVHASLLPRWRGASPIQHAILHGDTETGVTIQKMIAKLDAGPILAQAAEPLPADATASLLHDRLSRLGAELLVETLKKPLQPREQDEAHVTMCKKLTRADGVVDPTKMTALEIDRRVRALTPWPGVTCQIEGQSVKIHEVSLLPILKQSVALPCKGGTTLYIARLQSPGKRVVTAEEWQRGRHA